MPSTDPLDSAPVEEVGGPQDSGPWPSEVEEIARGESYQRPVVASDGTEHVVEATVTGLREVLDERGNPTGGKVVTVQYPTPDGGSQ